MPKLVAAARPILAINALYHIYLMARIIHAQQGVAFFSDEYGSARTVLLSLACVGVMEVRAALGLATSRPRRRPLAPSPPRRVPAGHL